MSVLRTWSKGPEGAGIQGSEGEVGDETESDKTIPANPHLAQDARPLQVLPKPVHVLLPGGITTTPFYR